MNTTRKYFLYKERLVHIEIVYKVTRGVYKIIIEDDIIIEEA